MTRGADSPPQTRDCCGFAAEFAAYCTLTGADCSTKAASAQCGVFGAAAEAIACRSGSRLDLGCFSNTNLTYFAALNDSFGGFTAFLVACALQIRNEEVASSPKLMGSKSVAKAWRYILTGADLNYSINL